MTLPEGGCLWNNPSVSCRFTSHLAFGLCCAAPWALNNHYAFYNHSHYGCMLAVITILCCLVTVSLRPTRAHSAPPSSFSTYSFFCLTVFTGSRSTRTPWLCFSFQAGCCGEELDAESGDGWGGNAWMERLTAGKIGGRKSNSTLLQSARDARLKNDGVTGRRKNEKRGRQRREKEEGYSSTHAGS